MLEIKAAKKLFFDKKAILNAVPPALRKALSKAGAYIRDDARKSIKTRKKPAPPGQPPHSHKGQLRKFIFFAFDPASRSVIVGPAAFSSRSQAPYLLEHGGTTQRKRRKRIITAQYEPRPYMLPALLKNIHEIPKPWKDAIR